VAELRATRRDDVTKKKYETRGLVFDQKKKVEESTALELQHRDTIVESQPDFVR